MSTAEFRRRLRAKTPRINLDHRHVAECRVLPNRLQLLEVMPKGGIVAEVGVAAGEFSQHILSICMPQRLHLIDAWQGERYSQCLIDVETSLAKQIADGTVQITKGYSTDKLSEFCDSYFDWVYIDTDHSYQTTHDELMLVHSKVQQQGRIAGHDFCVGNIVAPVPYGVIEACHQFCVECDWQYEYLTLDPCGFFSFCLKRIGA